MSAQYAAAFEEAFNILCGANIGKVLIQERTYAAATAEYPIQVPTWFTDLKYANWGAVTDAAKRQRRIVCHDYGTSLMLQEGTTTQKTKKAEWYDY